MYQVFVETAPLEESVELEHVAVDLLDALNDSPITRGAVVAANLQRRTLDMTCSIDGVSDAHTAILLAISELGAQLERLGVAGVRYRHAEADPETISGQSSDALGDLVTSTEAAEIVGVSRQRFNDLARRNGFPPPFGRIGKAIVYSRTAIEQWAASRREPAAA